MPKRSALFLTSFLLYHTLLAQAPAIQWQKCYGSNYVDFSSYIEQTADGGYIMTGYTGNNGGDVTGYHGSPQINDCWVVKLDASGALQWSKTLGGTLADQGLVIHQAPDGSYVVGGITGSNQGDGDVTAASKGGGLDIWMLRLSPTGSILWQQRYGGEKDDHLYDFKFTADGGYILAGSTESTTGDVSGNHGGVDAWLAKVDAAGVLQWQRCIGGSADDVAYSVVVLPTGYAIAGSTKSNDGDITGYHGNSDVLAARLDLNGNPVWIKSLGGSGLDEGHGGILAGSDGGLVLAASVSSNNGDVSGLHGSNFADFWAAKLDDATGALLWQHCYGGSYAEQSRAICAMPDGGYTLAGEAVSSDGDISCRPNNNGLNTGWVIKISSTGALEWQKVISDRNEANSVQSTADGGIILGGFTADYSLPGYHPDQAPAGAVGDFYAVKLGPPTGAPLGISIATPPAGICLGSSLTLTGSITGVPSNAVYTWYRNGNDMQLNMLKYTADNWVDGDQVYVQLTTDNGCGGVLTYTSNTVTITVSSLKAPEITITGPTGAACAGSPAVFTATVQGGTSGPTYRWMVNGVQTGPSSPTFSSSSLAGGDLVSCGYSDNTACYIQNAITSNVVTAQIIALVAPAVSISTTTPTICEDGEAKFTAVATNGGTVPAYQWAVNGATAGGNAATFASKTLKDGDVITCVLTSNAVCSSPTTASSNAVPIKVNPKVSAQVQIVYAEPICAGDNVTFTAKTTNFVSPSFNWILSGKPVGTAAAFSSGTLTDGDVLICRVVETGGSCAQPATAAVNPIAVHDKPVIGTANPLIISQGQTVSLRLPITGEAPDKYLWAPAESLEDPTVANPLATPVKSTIYGLEATTGAGCSAKGTLTVKVVSSVTLPSAFSPNGDGRNEVFYVIGGPLKSTLKDFIIFDRWGRPVFQVHGVSPDDPAYGWDGRIGGSPAPGGTYVYTIRIGLVDGSEQVFKGTVLLVR
ncbi:MAG: gliding motility-associated C-terminal domain-containing protein [Bacteroidetes bacterium]|nr:gliding motility-associated C-terminal domain-containing protein [Bacteroidota bacterium]